jgi:hypothetical protein
MSLDKLLRLQDRHADGELSKQRFTAEASAVVKTLDDEQSAAVLGELLGMQTASFRVTIKRLRKPTGMRLKQLVGLIETRQVIGLGYAMTRLQVHRAIIELLQLRPTDKVKRYGGISVAALVWGGVALLAAAALVAAMAAVFLMG